MSERPLHIAWIGFAPAEETGGVPGIATDLLHGLAARGHRIDCYFPARERELPAHITGIENLNFVWGDASWEWGRWYSRGRVSSFLSSQLARGLASYRLRGEVLRRHGRDRYDVFYQFSNVENLSIPRRLRRTVPLVAHPGQSSADALRFLLRERRLSMRGRPSWAFLIAAAMLWLRARVQGRQIRGAALVVCISNVFRDHLMRDYGLKAESAVVVPNPVRLERFEPRQRPVASPARIIVLGRIATGKGLESVVELAKRMCQRGDDVRFRIVGGTSVWSNYTRLLDDLPEENSEYAGHVEAGQVPAELEASDMLLQASKYEAFALTVAEALAAGVPVIATTEVGAIEQVDRSVAAAVAPGDVEAMAAEILAMRQRLEADPLGIRALARAEAERLFAPEVVCAGVSRALLRLVDGAAQAAPGGSPNGQVDELSRTPG
jgi:glycosyltransferase involved in cell wall biosynthesis